jgi:hypothetical protein
MISTRIIRRCHLPALLLTTACTPLTQMQDTAAKFNQSVHVAGAAQISLFHQVQAAECSRNFYRQGFDFATAPPDDKHRFTPAQSVLDLDPAHCTPLELTNDELAVRQKLIDTITLYADAIQGLTNGTADTTLSKNSQTLAGDIQSFGKQEKFSSSTAGAAAALNAAVTAITGAIVDRKIFSDVKAAATALQQPLSVVVEALKAENNADAVGLANKNDGLINEMHSSLLSARDREGPASFLDIVNARTTLQSVIITPPKVDQLNQTLDAILKANDALARSSKGGAIPEISDLASRAQQASAIFNASK